MILSDNSKTVSTVDNIEEYLSLQSIADRNISELSGENGNNALLIYPHSFRECEDEAGKQHIFSLQTNWQENRCTEAILKTGNIVGFIGINGQSVSIHSRFAPNAEEDFLLHYMLHKVLGINVVNLSHGISNESIFDLLLCIFPKFLNEALTQGIYKEYQRNEYNDTNVHGIIDINRHLKTNIPFNGRIAYRTRDFCHDNHVTELIRHTIECIYNTKFGNTLLNSDATTRANVAQIIFATPHYRRQERRKVLEDNKKIICHPYYSNYAALQKLCLQILRHEEIKYGEKNNKIYGILFDVSYLWEEYLATILTILGFKHPNNRNKTGRIYLTDTPEFPRYPDFHREQDHMIADAKYKKEIDSRNDVNQIITYMYRLKGLRGIFIQPDNESLQDKTYNLLGYGVEHNAKIQEYFFQIPQNAHDYKHFVDDMILSETRLKSYFQMGSCK